MFLAIIYPLSSPTAGVLRLGTQNLLGQPSTSSTTTCFITLEGVVGGKQNINYFKRGTVFKKGWEALPYSLNILLSPSSPTKKL